MTDAKLAAQMAKAPAAVARLLSDERLARRATSGDERALEAIYRRYNQDLYRFCLAMTGNAADAQEALQNTMVKVLRALPGEQRRIKLKPWLYRIARNEAIELMRRRRDNDELAGDMPAAGTVAETAETRERLRVLLDDLGRLPERQRAALLLRELSGCDFEEIGAAFGTSAAVARQTLYEARLGLQEMTEGRERRCADVQRELSDGDGRVLRRRRTRAHLRDCPACRAFQEAIDAREKTLAGIAPLPIAASAGLLHAALGGQASAASATGGGGFAGAGAIGLGIGETLATSAALKSVATVAIAVVAATAADRTGVLDLPLPGGGKPTAERDAGDRGHSPGDPDSASANRDGAPRPDRSSDAGTAGGARGDTVGSARGERGGEPDPGAPSAGGAAGEPTGHPSSEAGADPAGGGFGRSAAEQGGRPGSLPGGADAGRETAASQKPPDLPGPPPAPGSGGSAPKPDLDPPGGPPAGGGSPPASPPTPPAAQEHGSQKKPPQAPVASPPPPDAGSHPPGGPKNPARD